VHCGKTPYTTWMHRQLRRLHDGVRATTVVFLLLIGLLLGPVASVQAQPAEPLALNLETMVELGLRDSYRVRQLQLEVERTRSLLSAEQAGLKSRVTLNVSAPQFQAISDNKWNSTLQRNELVRENTRRYQFDLSVRQPVILFGYPTNGVLSLNNRVYRYTQIDGDSQDTRFYNRYFIAYDQPLFQPNRMRNDLEGARLNLEKSELKYQSDVVGFIDDLASDYFDLVSDAYKRDAAEEFVRDLDAAIAVARELVANAPARASEADLLQVESVNAQESVSQTQSSLRNRGETVKQRLQLPPGTEIAVVVDLAIVPVSVDVEEAVRLASTTTPRIRQLEIGRRENEIRLDETRGNNALKVNLGVTYGREVQDPRFQNLWREPRNSYTVEVNATVPIWDWGQRRHRIQAQQFSLDHAVLSQERVRSEVETDVRNIVATLTDYGRRVTTMQKTLTLAHQLTLSTLDRYRTGDEGLADMLQALGREKTTSNNYLNAYLGYQRALRRLQEVTFFDFEAGRSVVERFGVATVPSTGR